MTVFALAITPSIRARRHGHLTAHPHRSEFARRRASEWAGPRSPAPCLSCLHGTHVLRSHLFDCREQLCGRMMIFNKARRRQFFLSFSFPSFPALCSVRKANVSLRSFLPIDLFLLRSQYISLGSPRGPAVFAGPLRDLHRAPKSPLPASLALAVCALA